MSQYMLFTQLCNLGYAPTDVSRAIDCLEGRHQEPDVEPEGDDGEPYTHYHDAFVWELGPAIPADASIEPYIPTPEDEADWAEYCREYEDRMWAARIEADGYITDADVARVNSAG